MDEPLGSFGKGGKMKSVLCSSAIARLMASLVFSVVVASSSHAQLLGVSPQSGGSAIIDFEGVAELGVVGNYYNGGGGTNYGVSFASNALALIQTGHGGVGNIANLPSPYTDCLFVTGSNITMNVAGGFTDLSFYYSNKGGGAVIVYSGLNGTGTALGAAALPENFNTGTGVYDIWTLSHPTWSGTAMSAVFGGTANQFGIDSLSLTLVPTSAPEASSMALIAAGLAPIGVTLLRRRNKKV